MFVFLSDTSTTGIYTLSLHDALPISKMAPPPWELSVIPKPSMLDGLHQKLLGNGFLAVLVFDPQVLAVSNVVPVGKPADRKSTRLNSSHANISYAVFCLKKKTRGE